MGCPENGTQWSVRNTVSAENAQEPSWVRTS
jgi:hypothetical protein